MDPAVPLVVPEVNADALEGHARHRRQPQLLAAPLVVALKPLADAVGLERVSCRATSPSRHRPRRHAGAREQAAGFLAGDEPEPTVYPHPIAFNVLPHFDVVRRERLHGRGAQARRRDAQDARAARPARQRHVHRACRCSSPTPRRCTSRPPTTSPADDARSLLMAAPGVVLVDEPAQERYPMPRDAAGRDEVLVGRIREDSSHPRGLALLVVERQPAQGRRHQRRADRRVARHAGLALEGGRPHRKGGRPGRRTVRSLRSAAHVGVVGSSFGSRRRRAIPLLLAAAASLAVALPIVGAAVPSGAVLPDLVADPPAFPAIEQYTYPDATQSLLLRFDGYVHNIGPGPLEVRGRTAAARSSRPRGSTSRRPRACRRPTRRPAGKYPRILYETQDGHNHFHLQKIARYSLWNQARTAEVAPGQKVGFCLEDTQRRRPPAPRTRSTRTSTSATRATRRRRA